MIWKNELQRHGEEVNVDPKETIEEQEKRINMYKTGGDRHVQKKEESQDGRK